MKYLPLKVRIFSVTTVTWMGCLGKWGKEACRSRDWHTERVSLVDSDLLWNSVMRGIDSYHRMNFSKNKLGIIPIHCTRADNNNRSYFNRTGLKLAPSGYMVHLITDHGDWRILSNVCPIFKEIVKNERSSWLHNQSNWLPCSSFMKERFINHKLSTFLDKMRWLNETVLMAKNQLYWHAIFCFQLEAPCFERMIWSLAVF